MFGYVLRIYFYLFLGEEFENESDVCICLCDSFYCSGCLKGGAEIYFEKRFFYRKHSILKKEFENKVIT